MHCEGYPPLTRQRGEIGLAPSHSRASSSTREVSLLMQPLQWIYAKVAPGRVETMLAWSLHGEVSSRGGCLPGRALLVGDPLGNSPPPSLGGVHVGSAEASYDAAVSDPRGASPTAPRVPSLAAALRHTRMVAAAQRSRSRGFRRFTDDFTREGFPLAGGGRHRRRGRLVT